MDVIVTMRGRMGGMAVAAGLSLLAARGGAAPAAAPVLPEGPGKAQLVAACGACHEPDMVAGERHDAAGWRDVVATMVDRGAQASDADQKAIVNYLATHFGSGDTPHPAR